MSITTKNQPYYGKCQDRPNEHMFPLKTLDDGMILVCPVCNDVRLKQVKCTADWRDDENDIGNRVMSEKGNAEITRVSDMEGEQDNIYLHMSCQDCGYVSVLCINQLEDYTYIGWRQPPIPDPSIYPEFIKSQKRSKIIHNIFAFVYSDFVHWFKESYPGYKIPNSNQLKQGLADNGIIKTENQQKKWKK